MDEFDKSRFARARRVRPAEGLEASFSAPEDIILAKLTFFKEGGSEKHLRDAAGVLRVSAHEVDRDYVTSWADKLGLLELWQLVLERVDH